MATLATVGTVAALAGTTVQAVGTIAAGKAKQAALQRQAIADRDAANFEAAQLDVQAGQERAAAQLEALGLRRRKNLALSTLQARAAGSGFTATDSTALDLADEIERFGTQQERIAFFRGEARSDQLRRAAQGRRFEGASQFEARFAEGRAARRGSFMSAAGTILGGVSNMALRFGSGSARRAPQTSASAPQFRGRYG